MMPIEETVNALRSAFGDLPVSEFRGATRVVVPAEKIHEVLESLKEKHGFDLLVVITCVDYLNYPGAKDRFGLVYLLASTVTSQRLTIRTFVNEPEPAAFPLRKDYPLQGLGERHNFPVLTRGES